MKKKELNNIIERNGTDNKHSINMGMTKKKKNI